MLRMYFVQCWFNLSDESTEEAIYDSLAVRDFVGIDLGRRNAPDATTLLQFRHLLEAHHLAGAQPRQTKVLPRRAKLARPDQCSAAFREPCE